MYVCIQYIGGHGRLVAPLAPLAEAGGLLGAAFDITLYYSIPCSRIRFAGAAYTMLYYTILYDTIL